MPALPLLAFTAWLLMTSADAAVHRASAKDPCKALQGTLQKYALPESTTPYVFARLSQVLPCTQSVAFSKTRDLGNLDSIVKYFKSFYGLLHVAKQSPDSRLPSNYDVISKLQDVGKKQWANAEDFYNAVSRAIDGLQDGNTGVQVNCPPFAHRLALPFVGVVEKGKQIVRTAPKLFLSQVLSSMSKAAPFKFDPSKFANARVTKIESQDAWTYVKAWVAENANSYHTPGQQLNSAFAHLDWYNGSRTVSSGSFSVRLYNPKADFLRVTLIRSGKKKAEVVKIPFVSYTLSDFWSSFKDMDTYYSSFCAAPAAAAAAASRRAPRDPLMREGRIRTLPSHFQMPRPAAVTLKQGQEVFQGLYFKVYLLSDMKTSVVALSTFAPLLSVPALDRLAFFVNNAYSAFDTANQYVSGSLPKALRLPNDHFLNDYSPDASCPAPSAHGSTWSRLPALGDRAFFLCLLVFCFLNNFLAWENEEWTF